MGPIEMMQPPHLHTVEEIYRMTATGVLPLDDRVELINGLIFDRPPVDSRHRAVVNLLNQRLLNAVTDLAIVSRLDPVGLSDLSEPVPDVTLLKYRQDFYADALPMPAEVLLLVELVNGHWHYEQDVKLPLYARYSIPQVWLLDLGAEALWIYSQPRDGVYNTRVKADLQQPLSLPGMNGAEIDLSTLF